MTNNDSRRLEWYRLPYNKAVKEIYDEFIVCCDERGQFNALFLYLLEAYTKGLNATGVKEYEEVVNSARNILSNNK